MDTMLWTACQKEMVPAPGVTSAAQEDLDTRISNFVIRAEHRASAQSDPRSSGSYTADSAAWYVEGGLNYSLTQAWLSSNELVTDSISIVVPSADGAVSISDVENAYTALSGTIGNSVQAGENHVVVIDVDPVPNGNGLELKVRYTLGSGDGRSYTPPALNTSYPSYTFLLWYTQTSGSSCDPDHYSAKGADKTIQDRVAFTIPPLAYGQYYASVETWMVAPNGDYLITDFPNASNTSGHSNQDNLIYSWEGGTGSFCLDANDMTFHTQGTYDVMLLIKAAQCPTKQLASITVLGDLSGGWETYDFHRVTYTYGKPQYRKN